MLCRSILHTSKYQPLIVPCLFYGMILRILCAHTHTQTCIDNQKQKLCNFPILYGYWPMEYGWYMRFRGLATTTFTCIHRHTQFCLLQLQKKRKWWKNRSKQWQVFSMTAHGLTKSHYVSNKLSPYWWRTCKNIEIWKVCAPSFVYFWMSSSW